MFTIIRNVWNDESGATAIEYGLIAALVSVAGIIALEGMGESLTDMFTAVETELDEATASAQGDGGGGTE